MENFTSKHENRTMSFTSLADQMTAELVPIAAIIILANLLVFALFIMRPNLRSATNYFLIGLAIADFLTGAVNIPLLLALLHGYKEAGRNLSIYHSFTATLCAYHILVITAEKFFAIMRPLRHYQMTKKSALFITLAVWCCSSFLVFIQLAWGDNNQGEDSWLKQTIYVLFVDVVVFVIPYAFMIYAYWTMFRAIARSKGKLLRNGAGQSMISGRLKQVRIERKCLIVFAMMALVYAVCWLPWFTIITLLQLRYPPSKQINAALHVYIIVRYLTSAFNPIIYTFFKRDFKVALKSLILRRSAKAQARDRMLRSIEYGRSRGSEDKGKSLSYSGSGTTNSILRQRISSLQDGTLTTTLLVKRAPNSRGPLSECSAEKTKANNPLGQLINNATESKNVCAVQMDRSCSGNLSLI